MAHPTAKFVRRVWQRQRLDADQEAHAFLAFFDDDHVFTEGHLAYPQKSSSITIPHGAVDLYFAPCLFRRKRRRNEYALPGRWLYADLDESDPRRLTELPPTVAWETSRGRYQAMWQLDAPMPPEELADLNQKVTYFTDADKGGWSLTKVLRVPGSISTKHGDDWRVRLMWWKDIRYTPEQVAMLTRKVKTPQTRVRELGGLKLPKRTPKRIVAKYRKSVPARAMKLIKATEARGDRSERLWMLYQDLLSSGMKPEEVLVVVRASVWNKYAGQRRELRQLWTEVNKAKESLRSKSKSSKSKSGPPSNSAKPSAKQSSVGSKKSRHTSNGSDNSSETSRRDLTTYSDFMSKKIKRPGWMVEAIWAEGAHGVLSGEPKAYKSVISTDLAISVASGTPFLETFEIPSTGPVIMIQEENDPGEFQDRFYRIANSRGLLGSADFSDKNGHFTLTPNADLPIYLLNNEGFDLTNKKDLNWLIRQCSKVKPELIVLDPFYLMTPGVDENSAAQVTPVLKRLLKIKQHFGVGIQIIHHYRKQNVMAPSQGAQRMSGTGVFHRWFESAVYVEKTEGDPSTVRLVPDHRGHAPQGAMRVTFDLGSEDDLHYQPLVYTAKADKADLHARLRNLMKEQDEWTLNELRKAMGMSSTKPLKQMIKDHNLIMVTRRTGERGRPAIVVKKPDAKYRTRSMRDFEDS